LSLAQGDLRNPEKPLPEKLITEQDSNSVSPAYDAVSTTQLLVKHETYIQYKNASILLYIWRIHILQAQCPENACCSIP